MEIQEERKTENRKAGILLPVFSLPSNEGIGTLGKGAYQFVDWLKKAGMKIWQVLPLLPTSYGDSPYQSFASDALNFYFIDFDLLTADGLLQKNDYKKLDWGDPRHVDYGKLFEWKTKVLRIAFSRFNKDTGGWKDFLKEEKYRDFAVFMALKGKFAYACWADWAEPFKNAERETIENFAKVNENEIEFWQFTQYLFLQQWKNLKSYANEQGISIMGDMPIYVAYDSVETWKHGKELFLYESDGKTTLRAGVPPDAFSDDGQLWGNPVYNWEKMEANDYAWWKRRIEYAFTLFDIVRIDHFRGFDRFYTVAEGSDTAKEGEWRQGPGAKLFESFKDRAIVAEDLGIIDDGVREMMRQTGYPGMKVLSFGFDGNPDNEHKASNHTTNVYAYTGTHDNAPIRQMIEELGEENFKNFRLEMEKENERLEITFKSKEKEEVKALCENLIEQLFASPASVALVPMQDVLFLGEESRLNRPSSLSNSNWSYRFVKGDFTAKTAKNLSLLVKKYNR